MSVSRDSAGGRLHPPLLDMLPWSLAAVLVVSLLFVLLNLETMDTGDSLDLWLIRWTRAAGNPERLAGPPLLQESLRDVTALGGYAVLILVSVVFAGFAWVELSRGVCCFFSGTVWGWLFSGGGGEAAGAAGASGCGAVSVISAGSHEFSQCACDDVGDCLWFDRAVVVSTCAGSAPAATVHDFPVAVEWSGRDQSRVYGRALSDRCAGWLGIGFAVDVGCVSSA